MDSGSASPGSGFVDVLLVPARMEVLLIGRSGAPGCEHLRVRFGSAAALRLLFAISLLRVSWFLPIAADCCRSEIC